MTQLPILPDCQWRRDLGGQLFCLHLNAGDRNTDIAEPIEVADCQRCIIREHPNKRPRKEPTAASISPRSAPRPAVPQQGPGTELSKIFHGEMGIKINSCGGCAALLAEMNTKGVQWCKDNIDDIAQQIKVNAKAGGFSVVKRLKAGGQVLLKGLPWTLKGIIEEAIRRAEAADAASS